jgi:hypothetical protein
MLKEVKVNDPSEHVLVLIARKKEALDWRFSKDVSDVRSAFDNSPLAICHTNCERVYKVFMDEGFTVWKNGESDYRISVPSVLPWEVQNV